MDLNSLRDLPPWQWPPDAGDLLTAALLERTSDASKLQLAAELAGNFTVASDDLARALLAVVERPDAAPKLRGTAAISLGPVLEEADLFCLDDEGPLSHAVVSEIQATLRAVHLDADAPKEVRRRALEASVRAEGDWHPEAVRGAYRSGDPEWKLTAVFCMGYVEGFEHEIVEALASEDPHTLRAAVRAAGAWGMDAAWPRIRALLQAREIDKRLMLAAIEAAGAIQEDELELAEVLDPLMDSHDEEIAEAALDALARSDWEETEEL